jgi:ubiquinone/menaquinone biosynthesis C-methylase UbiE
MIIGCTEMPGLGDGTSAANWVSYDAVVESYERYHVDRGYALQARDIVLMLGLADGARVLDVGTGTGEAALAALARCTGVVGLDPSLPMLRLATKKGLGLVVAGEAAGLPFRSEQFDAVVPRCPLRTLGCGGAEQSKFLGYLVLIRLGDAL